MDVFRRTLLGYRTCLLMLFCLAAGGSASAQFYNAIPLQAPGGYVIFPRAINDNGDIAGDYQTPDGVWHLCIWSKGIVTELPKPPWTIGNHPTIRAMNNAGQVVGEATYSNGNTFGVIWTNGNPEIVAPGGVGAWITTRAWHINDRGDVLCNGSKSGGGGSGAFLAADGVFLPFTFFPFGGPGQNNVNNSGEIVNRGYNGSGFPALWRRSGTPSDLTSVLGADALPKWINNDGIIVGGTLGTGGHAFILDQTASPSLTVLPDQSGNTFAMGINDRKTVFGYMGNVGAVIWKAQSYIPINSAQGISGFQNGNLSGVMNNNDEIACIGVFNNPDGFPNAGYLLRPVVPVNSEFIGKGDLGFPNASSQPGDKIADPVSVTKGYFHEQRVDLVVNGPLPITISRSYSSVNHGTKSEYGYGWLAGYSSYIIPSADGSTIQVADTDGSVVTFRQQSGSTTIWSPTTADNPNLTGQHSLMASTITKSTPGGITTYRWDLADGSSRKYTVQTFTITASGFTYSRERPFLTELTDSRGNSLSFSYGTTSNTNEYGRMRLIQSSNGSSVTLTYDALGHLIQVAANDGRTVGYSYIDGNLAHVTLPDNAIFQYQYAPFSHLISDVIAPDSRITRNVYDSVGRVVQQFATSDYVNPTSLVLTATFDYNVAGQTTVRDAFNRPTVYLYNSAGLITSITDALGQTVTQTWYTGTNPSTGAYANSLERVVDKRGLITDYKYDAQGNVIETRITGDLTGDPNASPQTALTSATYNVANVPTSVTDASGSVTTFLYEDSNYPTLPTKIITSKGGNTLRTDVMTYTAVGANRGLLATKTVASGTSDQAVTGFSYTSAGLIQQQTEYTGTSDPNVVTTFGYNARNEVITVTDGDGRSTVYTYDGMSRPLTKTIKDESNNVLGTWSTTYNGNGDVSLTTGPRTSPADTVQRVYDGAGRLSEEIASRSAAKSDGTGVVANGSVIASHGHDVYGNRLVSMDGNGNTTTMSYDAIGRMLTRSTAGMRLESFQYEPGNKLSQYTSPINGVTNLYYTQTGRLCKQENADGSVTQWRHYTDGRLQQEIQRDSSYWTTTYDDINRVVTRTLYRPNGTVLATESKQRDRRGNVVSQTDPDGFVRTTTYDGLNRVTVVTGPASVPGSNQQTTTAIYGATTKAFTVLNGLNEQVVTNHDALGRPTQKRVINASGTTIRTTSYSYSADHNAVTETLGTGPTAVSRTIWTDTFNRPVLTRNADNTFTRVVYDANGNRVSSTDPLGQATAFQYNAIDQLITEILPDSTITRFTYDAAGNLLTRLMANSALTFQQSFDPAGRKTTEQLFSASASTRQFTFTYYPAGNAWAGLLKDVAGPRATATTSYDDFLRPAAVTMAGTAPETNLDTTFGYNLRGLMTSIAQSSTNGAAGPATLVSRTFDGYGNILIESVTVGGAAFANISQSWDAGGRRASFTESNSTLPSPLYAYQYDAAGAMAQVTANNQNYTFTYGNNGLLTARINPYRSLAINSRDLLGRILQQTTTVNAGTVMVENMTWRADSTLGTYTTTKNGSDSWNEALAYNYNTRGQLLSEGFSPAAGVTSVLSYAYDGTNPGVGVRTDAKVGTGAPVSWETNTSTNSLGQVLSDNQTSAATGQAGGNPGGVVVRANGLAADADHVDVLVDGVLQGRASYAAGVWGFDLNLTAGQHTLTANAVDTSGLYTQAASSTFTVTHSTITVPSGTITNGYDGDGNVITRTWASGHVQSLTWDALGRLIKLTQRDSTNNGFDWSAVYDGLGRRLSTTHQPVTGGVASGAPTITTSIFDPQAEFLEVGVAINGAKAWKVFGPDLGGALGALQGTGGLEATIVQSDGTTKGVIVDQFGNCVATVSGTSVTWTPARTSAYGPLAGDSTEALTDPAGIAEASVWRTRRVDSTGLICLGARYYDAISGRFLSTDPMGYASSRSLYDFAGNDPVNNFDPDGRLVLPTVVAGVAKGAAAAAGAVGVSATALAVPVAASAYFVGRDVYLVYDTVKSNRIGDAALENALRIERETTEMRRILIVFPPPPGAMPHQVGEYLRRLRTDPANAEELRIRMWTEYYNRKAAEEDAATNVSPLKPRPSTSAKQLEFDFAEEATSAERTTYLYQKLSAESEHLKYGITYDPATRYSAEELAGGRLNIIGEGSRAEMLKLERTLHETMPIGPQEKQEFYTPIQVRKGLLPPSEYKW